MRLDFLVPAAGNVRICEARHHRSAQRRIYADRSVAGEDLDLGQFHRIDGLHLVQPLDAGDQLLEQLLDALRGAFDKVGTVDLACLQPVGCRDGISGSEQNRVAV